MAERRAEQVKLNNGTKWGLGIGVVVAIVAIVALGIEVQTAMGSITFKSVIGGTVIGQILGMIIGMKSQDWN